MWKKKVLGVKSCMGLEGDLLVKAGAKWCKLNKEQYVQFAIPLSSLK